MVPLAANTRVCRWREHDRHRHGQHHNQVEFNDPNDLAGFAGDITGLTTLTLQEGSNPFGHVQVGLTGHGLNTALETLNINAGLFR